MKLKSVLILLFFCFLNRVAGQNPVYEWAHAIGTNTASYACGTCIKTDAAGNVYLSGYFRGALDVDPSAGVFNITSYDASTDFFVAKYNSTGVLQWAKSIGGAQTDECTSLAIDNLGNVLLTGNFRGTVDLDPGPGVSSYSVAPFTTDIFFEKLDPNGNFIWVRTISNNNQKRSYSIIADQNNDIIITGYFTGVVDFDPGPSTVSYTSTSAELFFLAKYDSNGNYNWVDVGQQYSGKSIGRSLVCDNNNNIFLGGHYSGKLDFDPSANVDTLTAFGGNLDIFFAKYDAAGNFVFVKHATGGGSDSLNCITLDANKNILIAGHFPGGVVDFDPSPGTAVPIGSSNSTNLFIAKYDSLGNYFWVFPVGSNVGTNNCRSIVTDAIGNVYATGFFQGAADFDPSPTNAILGATGTLDIFMAKYGPNGNYLWAKKFGAAFSNSGHSIALNASGNVLITGNFYSVVDFDPSAAVYNLSSSVFNAYLKSNVFVGQYNQVTAAFSSAFAPGDYQFNEERSYSVKNDQLGNVFICGEFSGAIDFDFSPVTDYYMASAGGTDGFVAKYSPAGALIWARRIGGPKTDVCYGLAIDNLGNCLITGTFDSTATFNAALTATLASNGSQDVFLMKLNPVGFLLWHTGFGGTGNDRGKTIAVNSANDVYVAGYFEGTVDTDPSAGSNILFSNGATDIFFSGFAPNGNFVWGKGIGSATDDEPRSIAIDNAGELVMTGGFSQTTDFDPGPGFGFLNCSGAYDIFLAKYNSSGAYIFANKIGAAGGDHAMSLCVDAANNYIISGDFSGTVDFDPATFSTVNLIASGPYDGFVAKYNSLGTYQWVRHISGINGQTADGVNTDLNSNIYITGKYGATTNFGSIILSNTGPLDQYISKYDASGNNLWVSRAGGNNFNVGGSLVIDNSNNIYSTGYFYGVSDFDPSFLTANLASAGAGDVFLLKYKQCITTSVSVSSQSNVSCYGGNNGFVNLIASGGTGITYSWTPTGNTTASLTSLSIGSYSCLVMNSCGAASSINITVTQPSSLNINMGMSPTLICQGVNTILQANVTGGTPAYTYTWSTGANTAPISFPATVSGGYTCTITDAKGCIKTATTAIVVNTSPTVNIVASTNTLCANTTATLNASGANSYTWNPNVVSSSVVVSPSVTSTYTVTGKSLNGCADTETVSLIVSPGPPLNVVSTSSILCLGNTATITATGSSTYTWSNGNNTNAIVITPTANITYTVTGISSAGCVDSISYTQNVSICTGLDGSLSKNNSIISVYPNPNTGEFYIGEFENNIGKEVEVFNSIGQLVQQFKIETNIPKVNINEHPNGFYFVVIKDKDASIHNSKIVKTN